MEKRRGKKGAIWWDNLGWAIIALVILVIIILGVYLLNRQGIDLIQKLKDILRFGR
jgi:hypothetical protein